MKTGSRAVDAVLLIAFGGPESMDDVRPFLSNVTQGRVPASRLEAVVHHYAPFGGKSPVKEMSFRQAGALENVLRSKGLPLPVYVGMRNWHPFLADTLRRMAADGKRRAVVLIMSAFESRSSWDQYKSDVTQALAAGGLDVEVTYTDIPCSQAGYVEALCAQVKSCLDQIDPPLRETVPVLFTAHSLPRSDPKVERYVEQFTASAEAVSRIMHLRNWQLVYQSRSGRPQDPWLEPDINNVLKGLAAQGGVKYVVAVPAGFLCDNMEILYDLDMEAAQTARESGITLVRAGTVNDTPVFINALADLVAETAMHKT